MHGTGFGSEQRKSLESPHLADIEHRQLLITTMLTINVVVMSLDAIMIYIGLTMLGKCYP
jgi:hypothetical protein